MLGKLQASHLVWQRGEAQSARWGTRHPWRGPQLRNLCVDSEYSRRGQTRFRPFPFSSSC